MYWQPALQLTHKPTLKHLGAHVRLVRWKNMWLLMPVKLGGLARELPVSKCLWHMVAYYRRFIVRSSDNAFGTGCPGRWRRTVPVGAQENNR